MDARCRIELLGRLRVTQGEREITRFRTQKTEVLLRYVAYHIEHAHPREVLVELLRREGHPRAKLLRLSPCRGSGRVTHPQGGRRWFQ